LRHERRVCPGERGGRDARTECAGATRPCDRLSPPSSEPWGRYTTMAKKKSKKKDKKGKKKKK